MVEQELNYKIRNIQNKLKKFEKQYEDVANLELGNKNQISRASEQTTESVRGPDELQKTRRSSSEQREGKLNIDGNSFK